jgi:hypothetical protein
VGAHASRYPPTLLRTQTLFADTGSGRCRWQRRSMRRVYAAAVETGSGRSAGEEYPTIEQLVGNTPLVRLQRLPGITTNVRRPSFPAGRVRFTTTARRLSAAVTWV